MASISFSLLKKRFTVGLLLVTLLGLVALLIAPLAAYYRFTLFGDQVDARIEPAHRQLTYAIDIALEAHEFALTYDFLLDQTPHPALMTPRTYYEAKLQRWMSNIADERPIQACGQEALADWRIGTQLTTRWLTQDGRDILKNGAYEHVADSYRLFSEGMRHLTALDTRLEQSRADLLQKKHQGQQLPLIADLSLGLVCLLLAGIAGWNLQRLNLLEVREREMTGQLHTALNEIQHRVRNNLQAISILVEFQAMKEGEPDPALKHLTMQVRAVSAANEFTGLDQASNLVQGSDLIKRLVAINCADTDPVVLQLDRTQLSLDQATSVAIILTELLQDCRSRKPEELALYLETQDQEVHLQLDRRLSEAADPTEGICCDPLSLELIKIHVSHNLKGKLEYDAQGDQFKITFPLFQREPGPAANVRQP